MKNMVKKLMSVVAALALVVAMAATAEVAAEDAAVVYVTLSDGTLVLANAEVTVTDIDGDGAITINDALYCTHETYFEGGAEAGYLATESNWGLSLMKLWGIENGGSYGYYVNNASAWSLADPVVTGDHINAFVYTDETYFSDKYCYFTDNTCTVNSGAEVSLTLMVAGYDAEWNLVFSPLADARLTVDGEDSGVVTNADGVATLTLSAGTHIVSAVSDSMVLVPCACEVVVSDEMAAADADVSADVNGANSVNTANENGAAEVAGAVLPQTGVLPVAYFVFAGLLMVAGAAIILKKTVKEN